jgi:hypothetical protein
MTSRSHTREFCRRSRRSSQFSVEKLLEGLRRLGGHRPRRLRHAVHNLCPIKSAAKIRSFSEQAQWTKRSGLTDSLVLKGIRHSCLEILRFLLRKYRSIQILHMRQSLVRALESTNKCHARQRKRGYERRKRLFNRHHWLLSLQKWSRNDECNILLLFRWLRPRNNKTSAVH